MAPMRICWSAWIIFATSTKVHWEKSKERELALRLSRVKRGDNTTFGHVTIHSDYDHVSWGSWNRL